MTKELKQVLALGGLFLIFTIGAFLWVQGIRNDVEVKNGEIATLDAEITGLKAQAALEEGLVEELESLKANFAQYVKILPPAEVATEERLMAMLQEKSERSQFPIVDYRLTPQRAAAAQGRRKATFKEVDVTLRASGTFDQFLRFLNSLEKHESFLRVNSFTCDPGPELEGKAVGALEVTLNISTYRYESEGK